METGVGEDSEWDLVGVKTELAGIAERYVRDGIHKSSTCKKLIDMPRVQEVSLCDGVDVGAVTTVRGMGKRVV